MSLQYSMITSAGLQEIEVLNGKYIEIAYWLPALDIHEPYPITDITSTTSPNETVVSGADVYWATSAIPGDPNNPDISDLYKGVTYNSTLKSCAESGETVSRGNFQVIVKVPEESHYSGFEFNKLGLYAVVRDNMGVVEGDPFLFAQAITPYPQHVISEENTQTSASTFNEFVVDIQLELDKENTDFEDIIYGSTNDYWERVVNNNGQCGLLYNGSVFITNRLGMDDNGSYDVEDDVGVAKTLISTFHTLNKETPDKERTLPQLGLQYVDYPSQQSPFSNGGNQFPSRIRTTFRTTSNGHLEINMEGGCNEDNFYSIIPKTDGEFGLGISNRRWKSLFLSSDFEMYSGELSNLSDGFYLKISNDDKSMNVYNGSIYCGPYYSESDTTEKDNTHYFHGNISSYESNGIDHDLLIRSFKSTAIINLNQGSKNINSKRVIDNIKGWNGLQGIWGMLSDEYLYIASKNIYTFGNIIPLFDNINDLGSINNRYNSIYTKSIRSGNDGDIIVSGNLISSPSLDWDIGNSNTGMWNEIQCRHLGSESEYIETAHITRIYSNKIVLNEGDTNGIWMGGTLVISGNEFIPSNNNFIIGNDRNRIKQIHSNEIDVNKLKVGSFELI